MNQIINGVTKGLGELSKEALEKTVEETGKVFEPIISGKELLGDIVPMSNQEMEKKKIEEEQKKQKEMESIKSQIVGRNVEGEIQKIRVEKKQKEEEEERLFLENLKRQREEERAEMESMVVEPDSKRSRGKMTNGNKAKKEDMSATREYVKKPD